MRSESCVWMSRFFSKGHLACIGVLLAFALFAGALRVDAQSFSSGSDGSDGAFNPSGPPGTVVLFDPTRFHGTQVSANIFNFTTITIPQGITVRLSGNTINGPVFWLAQGDVDIEGTIDLSGGDGHGATTNPFLRVPSVPGSGGYAGGVGGNGTQAALPGSGPGGGSAGICNGGGGTFSGNQFQIPLVGGSGGGGFTGGSSLDPPGAFGVGGGAGGGAILIASSTRIIIQGTINANGGASGVTTFLCRGNGGSGGAIRLVSHTISGAGTLEANSGGGGSTRGVVRLEANINSFSGSIQGTQAASTPLPLLLPTAAPPSARVISIGGTPISPNPSTFPDITINTTSPVAVVIQTQNIPTTATIKLTILDENGVADTVIQAPPLGNCTSSNTCTTTVQITFPFGASRGLTKVTWTQ